MRCWICHFYLITVKIERQGIADSIFCVYDGEAKSRPKEPRSTAVLILDSCRLVGVAGDLTASCARNLSMRGPVLEAAKYVVRNRCNSMTAVTSKNGHPIRCTSVEYHAVALVNYHTSGMKPLTLPLAFPGR